MSSGSPVTVSRGDKVRHRDGTEGVALSGFSTGTFQVKTLQGAIVSWSIYDVNVIND